MNDNASSVQTAILTEVAPEPTSSNSADGAIAPPALPAPLSLPQTETARTDLGNARRLIAVHGKDLRYCYITTKWFVWDGKRWVQDDTGEIYRRAKQTVRKMLSDAEAIEDDGRRKSLVAHEQRSESQPRITAMVKLAESEPEVPVCMADFDRDPMLFNCMNGTLDLKTGQLLDHRRDDLISKLAPVTYDPQAQCPEWLKFLDTVTGSDTALAKYLQRCVGYSLTGKTIEQCLFLLYGIGNNGKTTFLEVIRFILGDHAQAADFNSFMVSKGESIRNDLAKLRGARFVTATESEDGKRLDEALIKQMTGGDTITTRFLYREHFEYTPQFKLWLGTNHKPRIRGTDAGIWRRIRLIPFTVSIPPAQQDRELSAKLKSEASGILNWALQGLADWQANGLQEPQVVRDATKEYRADQDIVATFLDARCARDASEESSARGLYNAYKEWAEENGEHCLSERKFSETLESRGFEKKRRSEGVVWKGIRLGSKVYGDMNTQIAPIEGEDREHDLIELPN